jgi:AbrB family looped-hinge helix DNA binding protein
MSNDITKVDGKFRVVITKGIRRFFKISPGDEIMMENYKGMILISHIKNGAGA